MHLGSLANMIIIIGIMIKMMIAINIIIDKFDEVGSWSCRRWNRWQCTKHALTSRWRWVTMIMPKMMKKSSTLFAVLPWFWWEMKRVDVCRWDWTPSLYSQDLFDVSLSKERWRWWWSWWDWTYNYHLHGQDIFSVSFIQRRRKNLGLHFKNSTNNLEIIKKKPNYHLFKSSKYIWFALSLFMPRWWIPQKIEE